jgi:GNAT superfamily N-acetyltransferase
VTDAVRVLADQPGSLDAYASVSSAFEVRDVLDVSAGSIADVMARWPARRLATPYRKDYDAVPGNHPADWPALLPSARILQLGAHVVAQRVGGALMLLDGPAVELLEGRRDLALLWDLRVAPSHRGRGVGAGAGLAGTDRGDATCSCATACGA